MTGNGKNPQFYEQSAVEDSQNELCAKVYKDKEFYQLGLQVCWPWKINRVPWHLKILLLLVEHQTILKPGIMPKLFVLSVLASFPGLPRLQFWSLAVCKNGGRRPGEPYHVIRGTGVTCRHAYMFCHAREKTDLAFSTSYEDGISADGEHQA